MPRCHHDDEEEKGWLSEPFRRLDYAREEHTCFRINSRGTPPLTGLAILSLTCPGRSLPEGDLSVSRVTKTWRRFWLRAQIPPTHLTHPSIRKVAVHASTACFSKVIFPSLKTLFIDAEVFQVKFVPEHLAYLTSLMGKSHYARQSLHMIVFSRSCSHLTPVFTSSLASLTVEVHARTSREMYHILMYNPDSSYPVVPNLTHLVIKETALVSDQNLLIDGAYLKMVRSREKMFQSNFLRVIIYYRSQFVSCLHPLLDELKSLGSSVGLRISWSRRGGWDNKQEKDPDLIQLAFCRDEEKIG
ncbi:uncharacterized protein EV420DRAFT_1479974 [Desarmillaria tabescens]|uniref:Uncharacterized protein n=1 Tax=Armillaria tabescens TaxID=1929756 RepID=A0AA39KC29_ARMTA|nr:uncharacterized protein EV420DRAFT_1479974 [Desarmillaria tabescens]KAK0458232.1 hypothetical protein EV420DRAFT_1479974 [Desarmillaria tabescens]